jgi:hypothetical protein
MAGSLRSVDPGDHQQHSSRSAFLRNNYQFRLTSLQIFAKARLYFCHWDYDHNFTSSPATKRP